MKFNITDRLILPSLFPSKDSVTNLLIKRDLTKKLDISQEERESVEFEILPTSIKWNKEKEEVLDLELSELEENYIKQLLNKLDKERQFPEELLDLYKQL